MIRSMTAFSRITTTVREGHWVVELRSLNHRYFEFSLKCPPALNAFEAAIRDRVQTKIKRGKLTVNISQEMNGGGSKSKVMKVDPEALTYYQAAVKKLKKHMHLEGNLTVSDVLKLPGIFTADQPEESGEKSWSQVKKILDRVLLQAIKGKQVEGRKLADDMHKRLSFIEKSVDKIEALARGRQQIIYDRIKQKVSELLNDTKFDEDRVNREVAFLAERSDITEETVRLRSHLKLFSQKLGTDGDIGRELDFICQEMNREINTISSKSQIFDIATQVIAVKGEIEKIREQVQNIE